MPAGDLRAIQAKVNIVRMRVERLLRGSEMVSPYTFTPIDIQDHAQRRNGPEHIASLVRAAWQLPSGPVRNLVSVIENAGGIVFSYPFGHRKLHQTTSPMIGRKKSNERSTKPKLRVRTKADAVKTTLKSATNAGELL
jgi:hypothetical protein